MRNLDAARNRLESCYRVMEEEYGSVEMIKIKKEGEDWYELEQGELTEIQEGGSFSPDHLGELLDGESSSYHAIFRSGTGEQLIGGGERKVELGVELQLDRKVANYTLPEGVKWEDLIS
jgi:hypothetical protein